MNVLRKGCAGQEVTRLQQLLKNRDLPVTTDGIFGQQTYLAVCRFQQQAGLTADGIVGRQTWEALGDTSADQKETSMNRETTHTFSSQETLDFSEAARILGVEVAAIRAVHEIESGGRSGFLSDGRPMILFEGHIFWKELKKRGIDPESYRAQNSDILFPTWDRKSYKGGIHEHERLERACRIHEEAALSSASWGMFQIMGFNYKLCGYSFVGDYVDAMRQNPNNHLLAFVKFLQATGIDAPLRTLDWETFAYKYNGPGYKQNQYDTKLQNAYLKYKN